jgi:hypothetical protein
MSSSVREALDEHVDKFHIKHTLGRPVRLENETAAEHFFYDSAFYGKDEKPLNERVRRGEFSWEQIERDPNLPGVEYRFRKVGDDCYAVVKQFRKGFNTYVIAYYYILGGEIYQSPSIWDVAASRVTNANYLISGAFAEYSKACVYDQIEGYSLSPSNENKA